MKLKVRHVDGFTAGKNVISEFKPLFCLNCDRKHCNTVYEGLIVVVKGLTK